MAQDPKKPDEQKPAPQPPTPEHLTETGAPVDTRFDPNAPPQVAQIHPETDEEKKARAEKIEKETSAQQRPKSAPPEEKEDHTTKRR